MAEETMIGETEMEDAIEAFLHLVENGLETNTYSQQAMIHWCRELVALVRQLRKEGDLYG